MKCYICLKTFIDSEMLQNKADQYFCKECFKERYYASEHPEQKRMFTDADLARIKKQRDAKLSQRYNYSKRPLQCPHVDCNKYVRCLDLNAHFIHEHMDVPVISTRTECRNQMIFNPTDIRYGSMQCLALIQLKMADNIAALKFKSQPVALMVLSSRIASAEMVDGDNVDEDERVVVVENQDKIILWVASNVVSGYSYTIAASTLEEDVRCKYYGPLLQLGSYSAKDLCRVGQCLILSHFHFVGMTEDGQKPLQLDLVIHSDD